MIRNPEIPPELLDGKYCRLDINMAVNGQRVDLEIQVEDEGNYPERSLYYWAREYSTAIVRGNNYILLPKTVIISILGYKQFDCKEFHSEFQALEVTRHTQLTDRFSMHYFELPKLPAVLDAKDKLKLWLALFNAKTEEDLAEIKKTGVSVMEEAIEAYQHISASDRLREIERMRDKARIDEAYKLRHAVEENDKKWQAVVAEKDTVVAQKDAALSQKDVEIAELKKRLGEN